MKQEERLTSPTLKSNFKHCVDAYSKELLTKCYWEIYDRLCEYENIGLSPEEIDTLKSENARLAEELKQSAKLPCMIKVSSKYAVVIDRDASGNLYKTHSMDIASAKTRLKELENNL